VDHLLLDQGDSTIDGGMVDEAVGNGEDIVRVFLKEADTRSGTDGEFGLEAGLGKAVDEEAGLDVVRAEEAKRFLPNRRMGVIGEGTAGAEGEMGACGRVVHKLFTSCSRVVDKGAVVDKGGVLNELPTSYEPFFSPIGLPYSINISTETEEEEYSI
jgi:hypothetical protein